MAPSSGLYEENTMFGENRLVVSRWSFRKLEMAGINTHTVLQTTSGGQTALAGEGVFSETKTNGFM